MPPGFIPTEKKFEKPADKRLRYVGALEHLKSFIDQVLEAFQHGTGILNNMPEPITHDVARRIIWAELQRVFGGLDTADWSTNYLWMRLTGPGLSTILSALEKAPGVVSASFRAYGARKPEDKDVAYACLQIAPCSEEKPDILLQVRAVLEHLWKHDVTTRDVTLGTKA
jgi:hypothetical protein